jgi:hypothetical protein
VCAIQQRVQVSSCLRAVLRTVGRFTPSSTRAVIDAELDSTSSALTLASVGGDYETVQESVDAAAYPMPGQLIDVGGHRLHLYCTGSGSPTVVLEPGLGEASSVMSRFPRSPRNRAPNPAPCGKTGQPHQVANGSRQPRRQGHRAAEQDQGETKHETLIAPRAPLQPPNRLSAGETGRLLRFRRARPRINALFESDPVHRLQDAVEPKRHRRRNRCQSCHPGRASELREGNFGTPDIPAAPAVIAQLSPTQLFDSLAIAVNGPRAWDLNLVIDVTLRDLNENYRLTLRNGVLTHTARAADQTAGATVTSTKARLLQLLGGDVASPGLEISGDESILDALLGVLETGDPSFNIITP